jgi:hypothetical protein
MNASEFASKKKSLIVQLRKWRDPEYCPFLSEDRRAVNVILIRSRLAALKERRPHAHPPSKSSKEFAMGFAD